MLTFFAVLAVVMTLLGGLVPMAKNMLSRAGMWRMFALRAGILLAVAFTEILPDAVLLDARLAGWGALAAFVLFFAMESFAMLDTCPEYLEECRIHSIGWAALVALFAHSFIDGFNLSVSFAAGAKAGAAVGVALALHKLADGFTLTTLFAQSGLSRGRSLAGLLMIAAATPLGCAAKALGLGGLPPTTEAGLLGFAAGSFIYIGATDILPRIHKTEDKTSLGYFAMGLIGLAALKSL